MSKEARAQTEAGCQISVSLIKAGARIEAGFKYTPGTPAIQRTVFSTLRHGFGYECHGGVSTIKRRSAMSKRKPHDIKFKFKVIKCAKKTTKEAANNIVLYLNGNRVLVVLCSHLEFSSNIGCPNRLVHIVLSNDTFLFKSAQRSTISHFPSIISYYCFL